MDQQVRLTNLQSRVNDASFKNKILVVSRMTFISYIVYKTNMEPSQATLGRTRKKTTMMKQPRLGKGSLVTLTIKK